METRQGDTETGRLGDWEIRRQGAERGDLFAERAFAAENVVIVLGEAMRFVAHVLQQPQRERSGGSAAAARPDPGT